MKYNRIKATLALLFLATGFVYMFLDLFRRSNDISDYAVGGFGLYIAWLLVDNIVSYIRKPNK